jgi:tetratricopeptide (TPR) repeat protein
MEMAMSGGALAIVSIVLMLLFPISAESREPVKPVSPNAQTQEWVDRAWEALDQNMNLPEIDQAIPSLEKATALDPRNPEILVELADEYYQRGDQTPGGTKAEIEARNAWFSKGIEAAGKALSLQETAGAHYWMAVNLAAAAEHASILKRAALFPKLNEHMDWIEHHDRNYKYGGMARFWSRVVIRVPGVVIRMVGEDPKKIFQGLEEAIQTEPRFLDNYVYKAEFYQHMDREQEALGVLDLVLRQDPEALPQERAYNRYAQQKARALWQQWTGKDYPNR